MAKTKKTSPGEAAAPARRRGTKALDLQPVAWVKVPSPQGVTPGAPVEVVGEDPIATDTLDTVRCGLRTFILEDGDRRWVAERLLDEQLRRLQTDHVDFYLLHALSGERWQKVLDLGGLAAMERARADGTGDFEEE